MQVRRYTQGLEILLFPAELLLFRGILQRILGNYQEASPEADSHLIKPSQEMDEDDWRQWREELKSFKGANQEHLERWLAQLPQTYSPTEESHIWRLSPAEIDPLLMVLNDHRLMLAARHGVDDHLMEADVPGLDNAELQQALVEIHLLAWLIETILQARPTP